MTNMDRYRRRVMKTLEDAMYKALHEIDSEKGLTRSEVEDLLFEEVLLKRASLRRSFAKGVKRYFFSKGIDWRYCNE